jgi:protein-tyrosine phosphatase
VNRGFAERGVAVARIKHLHPEYWPMAPPPFCPVAATQEDRDAISEVLPCQLYLTNYRGAADLEALKKIGVSHIVAMGTEFLDDEMEGMTYYKKEISDSASEAETMGESLRDVAAFIQKATAAKGCVLVHCAAGISRSSTVVLAYLMIHRSQLLRDAFRHVLRRRRCIWPNDGFMGALIALEEKLLGAAASISLREYVEWGDYDGEAVEIEPGLEGVPIADLSLHGPGAVLPSEHKPGRATLNRQSSESSQSSIGPEDRQARAIRDTEAAFAARSPSKARVPAAARNPSCRRLHS